MVHHGRKCIFIHIIKTAGTSIRASLGKEKEQIKHGGHGYAKDVKRKVSASTWKDYFKFSFVRNPWDKMVSQWWYNGHPKVRGRNIYTSKVKTFKEYILYFAEGGRISANNPRCTPWLVDDSGKILVDFVGRFENIEEDFNFICQQLTPPKHEQNKLWPPKLPHRNQSKNKHRNEWTDKPYQDYYDDETKEIIAREFEDDINLFGYKFEND
jgi:chondroitin 4-sulfotransferase 11